MPKPQNDQIDYKVDVENLDLGIDDDTWDDTPPEDDNDIMDLWEDDDDAWDDDTDDKNDDDTWDDGKNVDPNKYVPIEDYKQLQRSATKGVEKVINRNKILQETFKVLPKVADNPEELLNIYETNQEMAEVILENFYEWVTIEQFAEDWLGKTYTPKKQSEKPGKLDEDAIRQQERNKVQQELVHEHVKTLFQKAKLSKSEAKSVADEYNDLIEGKVLTKEKATKYFQIAYNLVRKTPNPNDPDIRSVRSTAVGTNSKSSGKSSTKDDPYTAEAKAFLKESWIY